jgi:hypothetical protein
MMELKLTIDGEEVTVKADLADKKITRISCDKRFKTKKEAEDFSIKIGKAFIDRLEEN